MEDNIPNELTFRASKRRKVFRKRDDSDYDTRSESREQLAAITNHPPPLDDDEAAAPVRLQKKKLGSRKHGIGFSSTERPTREGGDNENGETALVLAQGEDVQDVAAGDRFVRPTGRVAVTEDRHMTAYIDSKLAEARSLTPSAGITNEDPSNLLPGLPDLNAAFDETANGSTMAASERTAIPQPAQTKSTRPNHHRPTKRRGGPSRAQSDIARDSMIDQIMHEAQVPLYAQPSSQTTTGDGEEDNDAATAEAFKAQLLAEMEMQNRRRPAAKAAGKDAKVPSGPKLGGSRSQRERMKALEEGKGGKK